MDQTQSDKFRNENFIPVIDQFSAALEHRLVAYETKLLTQASPVGFLRQLDLLSPHELLAAASNLVGVSKDDLDACLGNELVQFVDFVDTFKDEQAQDVAQENFISLALRMYLVLMVSNCSAERSFSKMKLIKNRLRTSLGNERLSDLALMSIESDILRDINFEDLVNEFAKKTRKVSLI